MIWIPYDFFTELIVFLNLIQKKRLNAIRFDLSLFKAAADVLVCLSWKFNYLIAKLKAFSLTASLVLTYSAVIGTKSSILNLAPVQSMTKSCTAVQSQYLIAQEVSLSFSVASSYFVCRPPETWFY